MLQSVLLRQQVLGQSTGYCNYDSCYNQGYNNGLNSSSTVQSCSTPSTVNMYNSTDIASYCYGFRTGQLEALNIVQNISKLSQQPSQQSTAFTGTDFGDFSDLSNIPIIGGYLASQSIVTQVLHNEQGVFLPWSFICSHGQQFLLQPCSSFVNPDSHQRG